MGEGDRRRVRGEKAEGGRVPPPRRQLAAIPLTTHQNYTGGRERERERERDRVSREREREGLAGLLASSSGMCGGAESDWQWKGSNN